MVYSSFIWSEVGKIQKSNQIFLTTPILTAYNQNPHPISLKWVESNQIQILKSNPWKYDHHLKCVINNEYRAFVGANLTRNYWNMIAMFSAQGIGRYLKLELRYTFWTFTDWIFWANPMLTIQQSRQMDFKSKIQSKKVRIFWIFFNPQSNPTKLWFGWVSLLCFGCIAASAGYMHVWELSKKQ